MGAEQKPGAINKNERALSSFEKRVEASRRILTPAEKSHHSERLIQDFRNTLMQTPEFATRAARMVLSGGDTKKAIVFIRGKDLFTLESNVVSEMADGFSLRVVHTDTSHWETIALVFEKQPTRGPAEGGFILYMAPCSRLNINRTVEKDTYAAVEGAKAILNRLKHIRPLRSEVLPKK